MIFIPEEETGGRNRVHDRQWDLGRFGSGTSCRNDSERHRTFTTLQFDVDGVASIQPNPVNLTKIPLLVAHE